MSDLPPALDTPAASGGSGHAKAFMDSRPRSPEPVPVRGMRSRYAHYSYGLHRSASRDPRPDQPAAIKVMAGVVPERPS